VLFRSKEVLRRALLPFMVRRRLRRKRRAATLIVMFLQDSTGMSETMRAIYAFRHTVIRLQRWIRSWIEVQHCRMRILWIKCERIYREKMRAEKGSETKEEAPAPRSQFATNYFTDTVDEIAHKRKQLGRLLEDQENARILRQEEARLAEEAQQRRKAAEDAKRRRQRALKAARAGAAATESTKTLPSIPIQPLRRAPPKKHIIPWHVRIRNSATNIQIYDLLREILKNERRRHILNLVQHHRIGADCAVNTMELRRYLRNPNSYDGAAEISKKLAEVQTVAKSPAQ
jgi:hypothetical protein